MTKQENDKQGQDVESGKEGWFHLDVHPWVFFGSATLIILFVAITIIFQHFLGNVFQAMQSYMSTYAGWFFIATMNIVLVFVLILLASRFGDIRLGGPDAEPEFSTMGWFAMLFSAGMGIGLLFYSVAEPMFHFVANPLTEPGTTEAARKAMDITFLHWGLHPWGVYTIVALALAFFSFNKGMPLSIRTAFYPLFGDRIYGVIGNVIDIMATVATLFGVATSLGLGVQQVNAGLNHLWGVEQSTTVQVLLIAGITLVATWSVVKGLDAGIRRLSELNITMAGALALFVFILGPTLFICNAVLENIGYYVQFLPQLSTWNETYEHTKWQHGWTIFYWAWWIAWSPFVGMFIARVSYGRTIREFILGVLLVPTFITFLWITIFGNTALNIEMFGAGGIAKAVQENIPISLFVMLENFPLSGVTSFLGVVVVMTFFVTSSDSGSMVIDIITSGGDPNPPVLSRLFWAILEGAVAAVLLAGGGLVALQTATITTGLPFAFILLGMCFALYKGLRDYTGPQEFTMDLSKKPSQFRVKHSPLPKGKTFGRRRLW
ncbi:BCCT family transporter [Salidesulfovibrio brasiliensis]|uniref:BCCT family transporter n=1 Tax=Salidesulfovibrio brasiliensis TaxID=221711 RepID=UPI000A6F0F8C|nr:BCCT family transporter [Salidesulfovibrio brasiliensis]